MTSTVGTRSIAQWPDSDRCGPKLEAQWASVQRKEGGRGGWPVGGGLQCRTRRAPGKAGGDQVLSERSVFRGHAAAEYELVPSLLRGDASFEVEHNLFHESYARSRHLLGDRHSSWEALPTLQHHGIPTRLLDWTESFAIALFFALTPEPASPHIWIVNAFRLNQAASFSAVPRIPLIGSDPVPDYEAAFVRVEKRLEWPYRKPIFVQIPWNGSRVSAQQGFFTIHSEPLPLDASCPRWVRKLEVPKEALDGARMFLQIAGINEFAVFPDLQGLGGFLRERYRLDNAE